MSYNRYSAFTSGNTIGSVPFIQIPTSNNDVYETYVRGTTRFDALSYKYYQDSNYDWLINLANPELGGLEFNIMDGTQIRIPFPLESALNSYKKAVSTYQKYYGL